MPESIETRLRALGLHELIPASHEDDEPYPAPQKRILRLLATASTLFTEQSVEIMQLYRDIQEGKVEFDAKT